MSDTESAEAPEFLTFRCPLCESSVQQIGQDDPTPVSCPSCGFACEPIEPPAPPEDPPDAAGLDVPVDDLSRWLAGDPIENEPLSDREALREICKRHPLAYRGAFVLGVMAVLSALAVGVGLAVSQIELATREAAYRREREAHQNEQRRLERLLQAAAADRAAVDERLKVAERQTRATRATNLALRSAALRDTKPGRSLQLAVDAVRLTESHREPVVALAHENLRRVVGDLDGRWLNGHKGKITSLAFSRDGRQLASASYDSTARLWDLGGANFGRSTILEGHRGPVSAVIFTPDGRIATCSFDATVRLWSHDGGRLTRPAVVLGGGEGRIVAMAVTADGRWLAAGLSGVLRSQSGVRLFDLSAANIPSSAVDLRTASTAADLLAVSPNSRYMVSGGDAGSTILWNLGSQHPTAISLANDGNASAPDNALFTPDGGRLITSATESQTGRGLIYIRELNPESKSAPIVLRGHEKPLRAMHVTRDGRWLVTAADDSLRVWNLEANIAGSESTAVEGIQGPLSQVVVSPDGHWIAVSATDGGIYLCGLGEAGPDQQPVRIETEHGLITALAVSPDGGWLASAGEDQTIRLWHLKVDRLVELASRRRESIR